MNSAVSQLFEANPLLAFSVYSGMQAQILQRKGLKLLEMSSDWGDGKTIYNFMEFYEDFWLWTLGAYEVIRTMDQHCECFVDCKRDEIKELKKRLAAIRMPLAKQELQGNRGPIFNEISVSGIGRGAVFEIEGKDIHTNDLIGDTLQFLNDIRLKDNLVKMNQDTSKIVAAQDQ